MFLAVGQRNSNAPAKIKMSDSVAQHKADGPASITCAVITVSDTRTTETDKGGALVCELLDSAGHRVVHREIIKDEPAPMRALIKSWQDDVQAILLTGGTGITARDQTFETVEGLFTKPLPGYGELFRMLSYQEIGAAAMLSRTTGGLVGKTVVLTMPGSTAAVRLAMEKVILPELNHLVQQANK